MTKVLRDGYSSFVPRARLIKLLGGELIRDEVMAVAEIVKNAHDADAKTVTLSFLNTSSPNGEIVIEDDGFGMSTETLLQHWMQPAGSTKTKLGSQITPSGRRMLGEKGVGRFAVDRLGRYAELISRIPGSQNELIASFDWDQFDDESRLLSDVRVKFQEQSAQLIKQQGTRIRISHLRMAWKEKTFRRLCARLQRLISPAAYENDFRIEIASDEFPDFKGPLKASFLENATYKIQAEFDGNDIISCKLGDRTTVDHLWDGGEALSCGPTRLTIHCYDLEPEALARIGPPQDVRAWLREWSGISIYRNGFRVLPYGEPDDDWLRLDQRRVNNPVERLSNNQVCGYIEICRDRNPELRDQTNRGGLNQTPAFEDLRKLALFVLRVVEEERQTIRNSVPKPKADTHLCDTSGDTAQTLKELKDLGGRGGASGSKLMAIALRLERSLESEKEQQGREIDRLVEMAALGQGAAVASHALTPRIKQLRKLIRGSGKVQSVFNTSSLLQSEAILDELEQTALLLSASAPSRRAGSRTIDVCAELSKFDSAVASLAYSHGVKIRIVVPNDALVRAEISPSSFHQILYILLWNSLDWMSNRTERIVEIKVKDPKTGGCSMEFRDTGLGVPADIADRIFDLGFSRKPNGRGMGLAIARRLLARSNGTIVLKTEATPSKWTSFKIKLSPKRSRATPAP